MRHLVYFRQDLSLSRVAVTIPVHQQRERVPVAPHSPECLALSVCLCPDVLVGRFFCFDHTFHLTGSVVQLPEFGNLGNQLLSYLPIVRISSSCPPLQICNRPRRCVRGLPCLRSTPPSDDSTLRCGPPGKMMGRGKEGMWKLFFEDHTGPSQDHSLRSWSPVGPFQVSYSEQ